MTARKVWVCGRERYHGLVVEDVEPKVVAIAGSRFAADGRRRKSALCQDCREMFYDLDEARRHWAGVHLMRKALSRRGDGQCGRWVAAEEAEKWMCGSPAGERIKADGAVYVCIDCQGRFTDRGRGRLHWYNAHVRSRSLRPINHGTNGGYFAHRRRGEEACQDCKDAHNRHERPKQQGWWRGRFPGHFEKAGG